MALPDFDSSGNTEYALICDERCTLYGREIKEGHFTDEIENDYGYRSYNPGIFFVEKKNFGKYIKSFNDKLAVYIFDLTVPEGEDVQKSWAYYVCHHVHLSNKRHIWSDRELCDIAVSTNPRAFEYIEDQTEDQAVVAIQQDPNVWHEVKNKTRRINFEAVKGRPELLEYIDDQDEEMALEAVTKSPWSINLVKDQTERICVAAVKINPYVIHSVRDKTQAVKLAAVRTDGEILQCLSTEEQNEEVCRAALDNCQYADKYVKIDLTSKNTVSKKAVPLRRSSRPRRKPVKFTHDTVVKRKVKAKSTKRTKVKRSFKPKIPPRKRKAKESLEVNNDYRSSQSIRDATLYSSFEDLYRSMGIFF